MDLITFSIVVGLFELVLGLSFIASPVKALTGALEIFENRALMAVVLFAFLTISATAVFRSGVVEASLSGFLTVLAILSFIKILLFIWYPSKMLAMTRWFFRKERPLVTRCIGLLMTGWGTFLFYAAYRLLSIG